MPVFAALMLSLLAWRWAPLPYAAAMAAVTLLVAWMPLHRGRARRLLPGLACLGAALVLGRLIFVDDFFPCSVHCDGGASYARIAGVDVLIPAAIGLFVLALWSWRRRHLGVDGPTLLVAWILVGGSLTYLGLGIAYDIVCRHCLAVHTLVLTLAAGAMPLRARWRGPTLAVVFALALGATLVHLAPSAPVIADDAPLSDPHRVVRDRIDAVRSVQRQGRIRAEIIIDLQCPLCARHHGPWMAALADLDGIDLRTRLLVRPGDATALALAQWTWAAAAQGDAAWQLVLAALLGSPNDLTAEDLRPRLAEVVDLASMDRWLAEHQAAVDAVIAGDQRALHGWQAHTRTPAIVFIADGQVVGRIAGDRPARVVIQAAQQALATLEPEP